MKHKCVCVCACACARVCACACVCVISVSIVPSVILQYAQHATLVQKCTHSFSSCFKELSLLRFTPLLT